MIWSEGSKLRINKTEIELLDYEGSVYQYKFDCNGDKPQRANDYMDLNFRGGSEKMSVWAKWV